jgi:chemotaxis response regulator CheB
MIIAKLEGKMLAIIDNSAQKQRILIVDNESLLGAGVERLLSAEASFSVVGAILPDGVTLLEIVKSLRPDIVILDETYLLTLSLRVLAEFLDIPHLRVITVNANDDRVQMYYKQQSQITQGADLIHFIQGHKKIARNSQLAVAFS